MCRRPCGDVEAAMWWMGGPCDFSVSPSPFGLDFGTLDFGTLDSGLTITALDNFVLNGRTGRQTDRGTARGPFGAKNILSC